MKFSLRQTLFLSLVMALVAILAAQLLIRQLVILPRLNAQEYIIDKKDLERVKSSMDSVFNALGNVVYDNAVWEEMTIRMAAADVDFLDHTYNDPDFYDVLNINGIYYYDREGKLVWGMALDDELEPTAVPEMERPESPIRAAVQVGAEEQMVQDSPISKRGFIHLNGRPVLFVSVAIMRPHRPDTFQGTATYWRFIDEAFLDDLSEAVRQPLRAEMVRDSGINIPPGTAEADQVYSEGVDIARWEGRLHLLYRDIHDEPFMTLGLEAHPSAYSRNLLDGSLIAQLATAVLALILFYAYLNRSTINPILHLGGVIAGVTRSRDYKATTGLTVDNELGRLSRQIDEMLATIDSQQQELSSHNLKLQKLSDTDQLTHLANRRFLESATRQMKESRVHEAQAISLLIIDIDHFKEYNDHYGHSAGDRALRELADTLHRNIHEATDLLARYGGEEFVLVLTDTDEDGALSVAERLLDAVREKAIPHHHSRVADYITVSIGIATKPEHAPFNYMDLFDQADEALYRAKDAGRNRAMVASNAHQETHTV